MTLKIYQIILDFSVIFHRTSHALFQLYIRIQFTTMASSGETNIFYIPAKFNRAVPKATKDSNSCQLDLIYPIIDPGNNKLI